MMERTPITGVRTSKSGALEGPIICGAAAWRTGSSHVPARRRKTACSNFVPPLPIIATIATHKVGGAPIERKRAHST
jgi:hypothetical protein